MLYTLHERIILFSALVAVILGVVAWAVFVRKPARRRRRRYHYPTRHGQPEGAAPNGESSPTEDEAESRHSRRRRRRSRATRPLNPTLAETRGLPPVRGQTPPQP